VMDFAKAVDRTQGRAAPQLAPGTAR
jgi:hypothetical protein